MLHPSMIAFRLDRHSIPELSAHNLSDEEFWRRELARPARPVALRGALLRFRDALARAFEGARGSRSMGSHGVPVVASERPIAHRVA